MQIRVDFAVINAKAGGDVPPGLDDVERICEYCGKVFKTNKYKPTKYCSSLCVNRAVTGSKRTLL